VKKTCQSIHRGGAEIAEVAQRTSKSANYLLADSLDAHAIVVIERAASHVRITVVDSCVDRRVVFRAAELPALGAGDHGRPDAIAHVRDGNERASRNPTHGQWVDGSDPFYKSKAFRLPILAIVGCPFLPKFGRFPPRVGGRLVVDRRFIAYS